ncbi:N-acetylmuramoyl-L-alanine amidase [Candidatus Providencia siddallii]|uniref:N-acetylmuramoyl-L-alanine amidase n=1 Tax=Candidatus Providencia siddallii TaxID=1715285 RepID=A0ABP1CDB2_9GAMM
MKFKKYIFSMYNISKKTIIIIILNIIPFNFAKSDDIIATRTYQTLNYTRITFESDIKLKYKQFILDNPKRIIIDLEKIKLNSILKQITTQIQNNNQHIQLIRIGQFNKKKIRIVFELKNKVSIHFFQILPFSKFNHRLVLDFYFKKNNLSETIFNEYDKKILKKQNFNILKNNTTNKNSFIVVIDPGHGGIDTGAIGKNKTYEKDIVLQIASYLNFLIYKEPKIKSYMTRNKDIFISLNERLKIAQKIHADLLISIHADAYINPLAKGSSIFALSKKGATSNTASYLAKTQNNFNFISNINKSGDIYLDHTIIDLVQTATINDSLKFGNEILKYISKINKLHKNKVDQAGFLILKSPEIPSILIETAFISNTNEEKKLKKKFFQKQLAKSIFYGIKDYFYKKDKTINKN